MEPRRPGGSVPTLRHPMPPIAWYARQPELLGAEPPSGWRLSATPGVDSGSRSLVTPAVGFADAHSMASLPAARMRAP